MLLLAFFVGCDNEQNSFAVIENAVNMKYLKLHDRYLLWWFDEQGREVGIGDVAIISDEWD